MTTPSSNRTLAAMVQTAIFELEENINNHLEAAQLLEQKISTDFDLIQSLIDERFSLDQEDEEYETLCLLIARLEKEREQDVANLVEKKIQQASWSYELLRFQTQLDEVINSSTDQ